MLIISILLVCSLGLMVAAQSEAPVLNSTLQPGEPVYPGQEIIFYCESRGSVMVWQSDQYIGTGGRQLELTFSDTPNTTHSAGGNPNTVATLLSVYHQNGEVVLVSKLRIIVLSSNQPANVTCLNVGSGTRTESSFVVSEGTYYNIMFAYTVVTRKYVHPFCTLLRGIRGGWAFLHEISSFTRN